MTRKINPMTLEHHVTTAKQLKAARSQLHNAFVTIRKHHRLNGHAIRATQNLDKLFSILSCELDAEYHRLVDDDQAKRLGNIYHGQRES